MAIPRPDILLQKWLDCVRLNSFMLAEIVRAKVRAKTPSRTGFLKMSCSIWGEKVTPKMISFIVGWRRRGFSWERNIFYAPFVGGRDLGVFGGMKRIYPKKGKFLRYTYKEIGHPERWVSMKSVKRQKPQNMLKRGIEDSRKEIRAFLSQRFFHYMRQTKIG